jgi:hypothetical protein
MDCSVKVYIQHVNENEMNKHRLTMTEILKVYYDFKCTLSTQMSVVGCGNVET